MKNAQFSAAFVRDLFYYAASRGADLDSLCRHCGLTREQLQAPDDLLPGAVAERAWQLAEAATGDADLGLHLGESVHVSMLGLLGFAMMSSSTLGAALERMARYWNLKSDATVIDCRRQGAKAILEMRIVDLPGNFLLHSRQPAESSLSAALAIARSLTGQALPLLEVASSYPPPASAREHERIFGRRPRFHAESNYLAFEAEALSWPVVHANPALLENFEAQIEQRLHESSGGLIQQVRAEMGKHLRGDTPTLEGVALALHKSARALQRELQGAGTTFREVLDTLRQELAESYLREPRHSIGDIAFLLGFSEPSAFHRSFRKWTGLTPQGFRSQQAPAE